ncbi:TonB system transport protein ExbD [Lichenihabitans sp. Uapishka_5]|uniref:TonB system transport protein ExbD n=1 Tax=Lichenihabitans sp. Uapishka_5 TaxID=3037302 RepID=UPI0029E7D777|nr:TonB system transport protein ExbD [Lichenihabitans sp. Uapishka_5]MDX7954027.1 TonB system transport protein ExbD [Lichenihabitans sp. Uapishka_5]
MAVKLSSGDDEIGEIADINVTPFIDVTLVLLIIFMVAAPLSTVDVAVNLPVSNAAVQPRPDKPVFLTVRHDQSLALGEETVARDALQARLDTETGHDRDKRIFVRADKGLAYGDLMGVMNGLRDAGYLKIALVGLEDTGAPAPRPAAPAAR